MRFGEWGARLSPAEVADLLEAALDLGIDTLDLADIYGGHTTNALVGAAFALRPGLRARLKLIAKIGIVMPGSPGNARGVAYYDLSVEHLRAALHDTLSALGTDRADTLTLHRFDPRIDPVAIAEWVREEQREGRVGDFGVSNFDAHALALFDGHLPVVANQIELSLANSGVIDDGTLNATRARGFPQRIPRIARQRFGAGAHGVADAFDLRAAQHDARVRHRRHPAQQQRCRIHPKFARHLRQPPVHAAADRRMQVQQIAAAER